MFSDYWCRNFLLPLFWVAFVHVLSTSKLQFVEAFSNFTVRGDEYACNGNIICLGDAHVYVGRDYNKSLGTLSLTRLDYFESSATSVGIAYYIKPIRLLDPGTSRSASFNTSFHFFEDPYIFNKTALSGDGLTFVLSADNHTLGDPNSGQNFGFFDGAGVTSFKSVIIEFDNFQNGGPLYNDINDNHVSIDIHNITAVAARNASEVGIELYNATTVYAWVEYSAHMQTLEVRISYQKSRPSRPFLSLQRFNLSEVIEEYMWVGFTAAKGGYVSSYKIGNWSFQSYGIPSEGYHKAPRKSRLGLVLGTSGGISASVLALVLVFALWLLRRRRLQARLLHGDPYGGELYLAREGYRFSHKDLSEATRGFADETKLGEGGFGCVYRGELPKSKLLVAVKKIARESQEGEKEFKAEVSIISQLRHRNLIQLLGWCIHEGRYYIVYDLMPNGSLDKILFTFKHEKSSESVLSWQQRFKIIKGIASAVEYLHHGWNQQVIHRDIKASNVMLDDLWTAKLGDFGLARVADHHQTPNTTMVAGTPGYIAPEAISCRKFTEKTDVFSFGALALELACGRRALTLHVIPEEIILVDWVWRCFGEGNLLSVVDKGLDGFDVKEMETLLLLGLICCHPNPSARPPMRVVVQVLYGDAPVPSVPTLKPVWTDKFSSIDADLMLQRRNDFSGEASSGLLSSSSTSIS